jgi:hypothetical protein
MKRTLLIPLILVTMSRIAVAQSAPQVDAEQPRPGRLTLAPSAAELSDRGRSTRRLGQVLTFGGIGLASVAGGLAFVDLLANFDRREDRTGHLVGYAVMGGAGIASIVSGIIFWSKGNRMIREARGTALTPFASPLAGGFVGGVQARF